MATLVEGYTPSPLLRAMVSAEVHGRTLRDRMVAAFAASNLAWYIVVIAAAAVVVVALFAICVAKGHTGLGGWYKVSNNWWDFRFGVGCTG